MLIWLKAQMTLFLVPSTKSSAPLTGRPEISPSCLTTSLIYSIAKAADDVIAGKFNDWFLVDPIQGGAGTSINMNTNEVKHHILHFFHYCY